MAVSSATRHIIWGRSGNLCAICKMFLVRESETEEFPLGMVSHIEGDKPGSKRYREEMADDERQSPKNLILLCPTCHLGIIDKDDKTYTVEKLHSIKKEHEESVERKLQALIPDVGFAELEVTLKYLIDAQSGQIETSLQVIPPGDKIKKNNLSSSVENLLRMGLMRKTEIDDYLNKNPDMKLSKRLRKTFVNKYQELKASGLEGDAIFYGLLNFSSAGKDFKYEAAGLTIISYYFHLCDVFES